MRPALPDQPGKAVVQRDRTVEALDWLESLEESFYRYSKATMPRFVAYRTLSVEDTTSIADRYPLGLKPGHYGICCRRSKQFITEGLKDFSRKYRDLRQALFWGLSSKTSSPFRSAEPTGSVRLIISICRRSSGYARHNIERSTHKSGNEYLSNSFKLHLSHVTSPRLNLGASLKATHVFS